MDNTLNLIKLCVGAEKVQDLIDWQKSPRAKGPDGLPRHVTRMWPKRETELLDGGSLYWVFKGVVLARQSIIRLDEVTRADGIRRCGIVLNPEVRRTEAAPKRPFQGWRYLEGNVAPRDLPKSSANDDLPPKLLAALAEIGVR
ncbi:MAG: DUF1489 domain-containing protein [Silicimonas sp.]|nr:DUF1489 domain-containing protein [Silicimonas sp.]